MKKVTQKLTIQLEQSLTDKNYGFIQQPVCYSVKTQVVKFIIYSRENDEARVVIP